MIEHTFGNRSVSDISSIPDTGDDGRFADTAVPESARTMDTTERITTLIEQFRLARLGTIADLDRTDGYLYDGYTSPSAFLVHRCGMGSREANREVFLARSLGEMPYAHKLARAGRISVAQLEVLAHARTRHPEQYRVDEPNLAESISGLVLSDTRRAVDYWCQAHCSPEEVEPDPPSRVFLSKTFGGRGRLDGDLDPQMLMLMDRALDTLIDELVRTTPREELAPAPQLRAEALGEVFRRYLDLPETPVDHGNRPHITAVVDWRILSGESREGISELLDGTVITPEMALMLACDARVCRLLLGPTGEILDLGRSARTVSPAQWRALRLRDRHCQFPGCRRPWNWCDAHHLDWWYDEGNTDIGRLVLLCRHHHMLVHRDGWRIEGEPLALEFIRPDGTLLPTRPPP